jgi:hypothetical protein
MASTLRLSTAGMLMVVLLLALAACNSGSTGETENHTDTFTVKAGAVLVVDNQNGSVDVVVGGEGAITVKTTVYNPDKVEYVAELDGDTVRIKANITGVFGNLGGARTGADIKITVPPDTELFLESSNGRVEVSGISAKTKIGTSNGRVRVSSVTGRMDVRTSNGAIEVRGGGGEYHLRTSNGTIDMDDFQGSVDAVTSNGGIEFSGNLDHGTASRLESSNGHIEVEFIKTPSVEIDASTSNAEIHLERAITTMSVGSGHIEGIIGDGDGEAKLKIRSSNGSVTIR